MNAKTLIKKTEKPEAIELTPTEKLVLEALYDTSLSNDLIAKLLEITLASVKFHAFNIYAKLKVCKRIELKDIDEKIIRGLIK